MLLRKLKNFICCLRDVIQNLDKYLPNNIQNTLKFQELNPAGPPCRQKERDCLKRKAARSPRILHKKVGFLKRVGGIRLMRAKKLEPRNLVVDRCTEGGRQAARRKCFLSGGASRGTPISCVIARELQRRGGPISRVTSMAWQKRHATL